MKKRLCSLLFTALLTMAVLGGCADGTGESSGDNSSVVVGIQQDIDSLDPHLATAAGTKEILFNIFEGLVKSDENGNLIGAVASDYTISQDGLIYTFTLRENVKFHNGNVVTVEDVKYSLERASGLLDGTALISTLSADKGGITSVDILDEKTVQVTVGSANTELIYSFVAAIIPAGSGEEEGADPVGTGPFSFVSYKPQEGIVVEKNPDYWQEGLPYLDQVTFKIVSSAETALMELQGGTIDIYPYLTDSQAQVLSNGVTHQVVSSPSNVVQALFLNNTVEPLDNVLVRQAI
ncbi:MAG: ABC transporter substrate-binding protein, partial [Acetatifactor sp.]|nr:ABC transporter substrate-binding protein [Acetatifactor sp.]